MNKVNETKESFRQRKQCDLVISVPQNSPIMYRCISAPHKKNEKQNFVEKKLEKSET